jgi:hypothetical protein
LISQLPADENVKISDFGKSCYVARHSTPTYTNGHLSVASLWWRRTLPGKGDNSKGETPACCRASATTAGRSGFTRRLTGRLALRHRHRDLPGMRRAVRIIACIEKPAVVEKILAHLQRKDTSVSTSLRPESRAPPADLFG